MLIGSPMSPSPYPAIQQTPSFDCFRSHLKNVITYVLVGGQCGESASFHLLLFCCC